MKIRILCFFWPIYLIFFLFAPFKIILSVIGLIGVFGTIITLKKVKGFQKLKNSISATNYCLIIIFSIFLFVKLTGLDGFNWLYFSTLCVIDHHFFYFINWTPWEKKKEKEKNNKSKTREWVESILFAIFAATLIHIFTIQPYIIPTSSLEGTLLRGDFLFVSKFNYGSNVPNTPLFLPFMHNTLPFTENTPSYLDWIQLGYNRLPGFQEIKNNDIVVFNWPTDNTRPNMPFDKKLNYVKRCIGIPGDSLELIEGELYINGKIQENPNRGKIQHAYWIQYDEKKGGKKGNKTWGELRKELHNKYELELASIAGVITGNYGDNRDSYNVGRYTDILVYGSKDEIDLITDAQKIIRVNQNVIDQNKSTTKSRLFSNRFPGYTLNKYSQSTGLITSLFPQPFEYEVTFKEINENCSDTISYTKTIKFQKPHNWDNDNYGPIYLPKKGNTIDLNEANLALYGEIITNYENNKLEIIYITDCVNIKEGEGMNNQGDYKFIINGKETTKYTIQMDQGYYWMMGDNRHNSQDSRCWGFVPFSHVVGKPLLVWLSIDWNADSLFEKIRWKRLFTTVHGDGYSRWYLPHFLVILILFLFRKKIKKVIKPILIKLRTKQNINQSSD